VDARIWKLTGPLMVIQDRGDARSNVDKRLEFISSELKKVEDKIKYSEKEFEAKRQELLQVQSQIQPTVSKN
jgi:prefoldin beta subunit